MLLAFVGVFVSVEFAIVTYFVLFITESLKYAVVTAGLLLAVLEGGGAFGKPLFGLISDRIFKGSRKKVYLIITATWFLCSLVLVFIKAGHSLWVLIPLCVILGASCIGWSGIHFTFIAEIAGKALVGSATSICMLFAGIAGILWPPIIGKIIDATGSYSLSWLVISVAGAIATLLLLFIREEKKLL
jgi:MFS family permease